MGETTSNRDLRRPDWMHSQAFANLWSKAYKAYDEGLILVKVCGADELHLQGEWRRVFHEGRDLTQVKLKDTYQVATLYPRGRAGTAKEVQRPICREAALGVRGRALRWLSQLRGRLVHLVPDRPPCSGRRSIRVQRRQPVPGVPIDGSVATVRGGRPPTPHRKRWRGGPTARGPVGPPRDQTDGSAPSSLFAYPGDSSLSSAREQ